MTDFAGGIAQISASYPPRVCGIADYTALLSGALADAGERVVVWTSRGETEARADGNPAVHPVGAWDGAGVRELARSLADSAPRVVHLQYERAIYEQSVSVCLRLPALLRHAGLTLATTFHSLDGPVHAGKAHRLLLLPLLFASRSIVVCSQRQFNGLRRIPRIAGNVSLIPVGNVIPVTATRRAGVPGPLRLVYFGFVWRGRNIETLLRALAAVRRDHPDATLDILGAVRDDGYRAELDALADRLCVASAVRFRGAVPAPEVSRALAGADMVLLPFSTGVSTGRTTLMAALAHGAPVVTMSTPDNLSPLFRDGENLLLSPSDDEAAFIAQTVRLAGDADLRRRLSAGAGALAQEFAWQTLATQHLALPAYREGGMR